jgi:hypothetical protein
LTRRLIPAFVGRISFIVALCGLAFTAGTAGTAFAAPAVPRAAASHIHIMKVFKGIHQNIRTAGTNLVYQGGAVETTPVVYQLVGLSVEHRLLNRRLQQRQGSNLHY